ncbi:Malonyl-CoA decarboxylase [Magnetospirillum gryphiswaldense MSR-1 v2]|uniref:Malonyl-CoA decarboxylase n=1 Tax=Magnetospirillum gryphiswaldense (strain DSM 6361 / JCM 21280 / NBRC 15271 / MSR-1) TaxID=431944 RepID=V6F2N3_MAGGM|nr:malonyl-CoA decarboxylase [Magnetospirillum gryphiswaldense]CDK98551.1 Malonyl-CoA decarboxylase [Magnetospirillum gryphiswaldense MSR-1 v2]
MTQVMVPSLLDRIKGLAKSWLDVAGSAKGCEALNFAPDLSDDDLACLRGQMQACLDGKGGEVSARARAAALGREYLSLSTEGRRRFLKLAADEFGPDSHAVDQAMEALRQAPADKRALAEQRLRQVLEPPRLTLLTQFNALPEGVKFLVDMRAELAVLAKGDAGLRALEADLKGLLAAWFDVGFLELRRLTWASPANVLEKLIHYEAVHAIHGWDDLKNRLDSDRRLYGFFHPRMPDEPLIFVEVALVQGMSGDIHQLLDLNAPPGNPEAADTAIFYSINNAQRGLNGISFGNFLIKRVVEELTREFKSLKTFATLSPLPGFRPWLEAKLGTGEPGLLTGPEHRALAQISNGLAAKGSLKTLLADPAWIDDSHLAETLRAPLSRLAARYLAEERKGADRAIDPVAHFHLSNGARIERLNWLADTSAKGLAQSCGLMVNYLYKLDDIETNHEAYAGRGKVVISQGVKALLKG